MQTAASLQSSTSSSRLSLAKELKVDHDNVRDLLQRFILATAPDSRRAIASTLIREIVVHCDAVEISIYNAFRKHGLSVLVNHGQQAHREIRKLAHKADETLQSSAWDYDDLLKLAAKTFIVHAKEEESDHAPQLTALLSEDDIDAEARKFLAARRSAPERPHPLAPQSGGLLHKAFDLESKVHDKIINGLQRREYVDVKFTHGG